MDRAAMLQALTALGARLAQRGLRGEMYLVGGAAIALAYDARRLTQDVDAIFEPKVAIYEAAREIAAERGLDPNWLNDAVKGFMATDDPDAVPVLELAGLRCLAASPRMLLAMKVLAHRARDEDDLLLLAGELGLSTPAQVLRVAEDVYGSRLTAGARFFVEAAMAGG